MVSLNFYFIKDLSNVKDYIIILFKAYIKIMFKEIWQNPQDILMKDSD